MDQFISHVPGRRGCWKGHATKKNVRNVIRANFGTDLRIFERGDAGLPTLEYVEIPASEWDTYFAKEA